jgi:hypothetical protein
MSNEISAPRAPAARSVVEREAHRIVTRHATLVDEVDAIINEILSDEALRDQWVTHDDPTFDNESTEGSVDIDKVRLADMVKAIASNGERYPLTKDAFTQRVKHAVQSALRRTGGSINQRRSRLTAAA